MNTLIVIGWLGIKTAYMNISLEEACLRWLDENKADPEYLAEPDMISTFEFKDEFSVYEAYPAFDPKEDAVG